ncbi:MAG: hypothetical protein RJB62_1332 [Pseudomonadota bacterium]
MSLGSFSRMCIAALAAALFLWHGGAASAQNADFLASKPTIRAVRIDPSEAPTIDADLNDPVWAKAAVIDEFRQRSPTPGAPASERTVARILYDENNLYFAIYAYDSEPDRLVVRSMQRDGQIYTGDNIAITLDPGPTWRNAYTFQIGPSGGRQDALRLNNTEELNAWNTIWTLRAAQVADGYILEMAIPFRSLSYPPGEADWGLEIARNIRRKNESVRWSSHDPALSFADVSQAGILTGISDVNQGLGLDLQPYVLFGSKHNWQQSGDGAGLTATAGGNAFYKITPALTGTLTFNTDFSDAPLDARQVNTTRFSLFTPETRDFFLQDAGAFEFGGRGFTRGNNDRADNNGRPFFSRNIGLAGGIPVSIIAGGKISGEYAGFGIGALSVVTDDTPSAPHQVLSVARITRPVFENSKVGFIVTNGDPTGATENTVAGGDFQYRTGNLFGNKTFAADISFQRSFSDTLGDDNALSLALNFPNEPWGGDLSIKQIGRNFSPELGFVNRTDIRFYEGNFRHITRYRDSWLRETNLSTSQILVTDLDNHLESRLSEVAAEIETARNNFVTVTVSNYFEDIPSPFDLPGNVIVPQGEYNWTTIGLEVQTSNAWPFSVEAGIICCDFYDGTNIEGSLTMVYRPSPYFTGEFSYEPAFIDLLGGETDIHLFALEGTVNFTPDMEIAFQAQYDNLSKAFGSLARFRWEYSPGNEVFVAFGQSADIPGSRLRAQTTQFTVRLIRTFQF